VKIKLTKINKFAIKHFIINLMKVLKIFRLPAQKKIKLLSKEIRFIVLWKIYRKIIK
jgi:hypothetical protein